MVTITRNGARFVYFKLGDQVIRETWQGGSLVRRSTLTPRAGLTADETLRRLEAKQAARTTTPTIDGIILQQLGGARFVTMVGARQFLTMSRDDQDGPGLQFTICRNQSRANKVRITLEATDTYTVTFLRVTRGGLQVEQMAIQSNVFAEMLAPVFARVTGLAVSL